MIEGSFGENGQIYFEIDLIGGDNFNFPVETMLDTGFTEYLRINKVEVQSLDWSIHRHFRKMHGLELNMVKLF